MADRTSGTTGWVIEVMTLAQEGPPSFKYVNAAIASVAKAIEAARKLPGVASANRVEAVRALSAAEITALGLRSGEIGPA
jgi:hypothetical protein